jgi:Fe-S-cluster-containing dehydrogenase component
MELPNRKWTMVIDLDKCTGCGACVVACHAENNVPIVSEEQVRRGRGQHWIRIERYWSNVTTATQGTARASRQPAAGAGPVARAEFLPLLCQQCYRAPCEPVCPVYATNHSDRENLNLQIYNRCVGTRYCSHNDPYKVRFFNVYDPVFEPPLDQQLNPDVTVRTAGVMEKCMFCVQRIRRADERALVEGRNLVDGEVQPACVQTCPPGALVFGDLYDSSSQVARLSRDGRAFRLLEHLGTEPQIYYLKSGELNGLPTR